MEPDLDNLPITGIAPGSRCRGCNKTEFLPVKRYYHK
jgi:hypothetical protein